MRILIVSDAYPPFIGGAHRQVHLLAHELSRRGHGISVATAWHPGLPAQERQGDIQVFRLRQVRTWLSSGSGTLHQKHQPPFPDPVTVPALRRLLGTLQPDAVHSYGWFSYSCTAALAGSEIPLVISARDYGYTCATRTLFYRGQACEGPSLAKCLGCAASHYGPLKGATTVLSLKAGRQPLLGRVRGVHSVSRFVQESLRRDLLSTAQAAIRKQDAGIVERVIPSFLIEGENSPSPDFLAHLPEIPFILYAGELEPRKGVETLLAAYRQMDCPPPLVLVGYGGRGKPVPLPPGASLLRDAPHGDVMAAWDRCLFGVTPSLWPDPSPGVVREAMTRGKAVVGSCTGGLPEMIREGETGLLAPPGDAQALAQAMQRLAGNADLRERLGQAARDQARVYRSEVCVPKFEELYRAVSGQKPMGYQRSSP